MAMFHSYLKLPWGTGSSLLNQQFCCRTGTFIDLPTAHGSSPIWLPQTDWIRQKRCAVKGFKGCLYIQLVTVLWRSLRHVSCAVKKRRTPANLEMFEIIKSDFVNGASHYSKQHDVPGAQGPQRHGTQMAFPIALLPKAKALASRNSQLNPLSPGQRPHECVAP